MRGEKLYSGMLIRGAGRRLFTCALALFVSLSIIGIDAKAAETKTDAASIMRMEKTEGTVEVRDSKGKDISVIKKMRLNDGNQVETEAKSYAYISLDDAKAVKLDAVSCVEVKKTGTKYEALLNSGNLFFNISEPLADDEELNIRTSTMAMGVRGTCAQVEIIDEKHTKVCLFEGSLSCYMISPLTGEKKTAMLIAGQAADFYEPENDSRDCEIITGDVSLSDIRGFALLEFFNDKELANRVFQQSGLDLRKLTYEMVNARLRKDQELTSTSMAKTNKDTGRPKQNPSKNPGIWLPVSNGDKANSADQSNEGNTSADDNNSGQSDDNSQSQGNGNNSQSSEKSKDKEKDKKKEDKKKEKDKKNKDKNDNKDGDNKNKEDDNNGNKKDDDNIVSPSAYKYYDDQTTEDDNGEYHYVSNNKALY